jgi:hypothetical protein
MAKAKAKKRAPARAKPTGKRVSAIPKGYRTVTPYVTVNDGAGALAFYSRGNQWALATHKEDVPPGQLAERAKVAMAQMAKGEA